VKEKVRVHSAGHGPV